MGDTAPRQSSGLGATWKQFSWVLVRLPIIFGAEREWLGASLLTGFLGLVDSAVYHFRTGMFPIRLSMRRTDP